jgi:hypothetical protein
MRVFGPTLPCFDTARHPPPTSHTRPYPPRRARFAPQFVEEKAGGGIPAAVWSYDLSPMAVVVSETRQPTYRFLTNLCAIIGGVFTVIGLVDSLLHGVATTLKFKRSIGKVQ